MADTYFAAYRKFSRMKDRGILDEDSGWMEIWIICNPLKGMENTVRTYSLNDNVTGEHLIPERP